MDSFPYRVFISYSHTDRSIVDSLVQVLRDSGTYPMWDDDLVGGSGFSDQIQDFISNSHIFLPVLTQESKDRPWLHQEIGYALALGKPIIPIALNALPDGIISGVQAIQLKDDLSDAQQKLTPALFRKHMTSIQEHPITYQCTDDNIRRAQLLAQHADSVSSIHQHGRVRQMASLTSFHLPGRGTKDPIWKKYYPATPDNKILFDALRKERVALTEHAEIAGCSLILDPFDRLEEIYKRHGAGNVIARVNGLISFLKDDTVSNIEVAINDDREREISLTVVGDWFSSEAVSSGEKSILKEAVFTRCATEVRQHIEDFDERLEELLDSRGWHVESSRTEAISCLESYLENLKSKEPNLAQRRLR
ncbi:MAG: toll/interleukin-1 receptor domain-containing protein [Candidatus Eisenbacteria bacterium]|uniref:Toll/interleukin-1 receptor domain-containing protein n=1 Tax=Eiseniibacteriota bacterium TaxID=2212470 RepID=A0A948W373_UNCEI|nr:toll/interleukin-1 receptor domain-containing protein [Candidatus Eisenbacteria bacterium]MBU1950459.1 toll/interleukin-1 receptor domain-containing protein [Candidatus Eisenbacteria bacterium]MBU2690772.1 toll/interleukin-1 receptor domain-containing protein [Candidatus Eisenbacteria bacterium]